MSSSSEVSSAEDERRQRLLASRISQPSKRQKTSRKETSHAASSFVPVPPTDDHSDLVQNYRMSDHEVPAMKNMSELIKDCQHLQQNIDGSPICVDQLERIQAGQMRGVKRKAEAGVKQENSSASAAAAAAASDDELSLALRAAILAKKPDIRGHWVKDEFERRLALLPVPEFYDDSPGGLASTASQDQLQIQLQRQQYHVFIQTAELESQLMAEAGEFVSKTTGKKYNFPPCRNGRLCVGVTQRLRLQHRECIFTQVMFQQEYRHFVETGQAPKVSRPCVQCSRQHLAQAVLFYRGCRTFRSHAGDSVLPFKLEPNRIRQYYQNLVDRPGGYHQMHVLLSNTSPDDPILDPICMPGGSVIFCGSSTVLFRVGTNEPRMVIDQSGLVWTAPRTIAPAVGVNLLSFCGGAKLC